ncbi:hypothetical protein ACQPW1_11270 [Nocardia sp. CA-128927]|uniref:hypothetical protein n=1 Tax=Nocardia sp. CA-128927 TaxID=3239975 RepID=UPI003D953917
MGITMRLACARTTALLAAAVLTAAIWVAIAPAASADPVEDRVDSCLSTSKTLKEFKDCYGKAKSDADAQVK